MLTFTPENGNTKLIKLFRHNESPEYYFQKAGVKDAHENIGGHLSDKDIEDIKAGCPPHRLPMRLEGEPAYGSGIVFDLDFKKIVCEPFTIPPEWKRVCGLDIGNSHRTGIIFSAISPQNDIYVYWEYANNGETPNHYAGIIKKADPTIPVILPVDATQDRGLGITYYSAYRQEGLNVSPEPFYNAINIQGKKDFSREYGIEEMRIRMLEGKLKVFSTCPELLNELASYHRDDNGKIVKKDDDVVDAARYSILSVIAGRGKPKLSRNHGTDANDWRYK